MLRACNASLDVDRESEDEGREDQYECLGLATAQMHIVSFQSYLMRALNSMSRWAYDELSQGVK